MPSLRSASTSPSTKAFVIEVDVLAVDDHLEGGGVGPVGAEVRDADLAGGDDLVAGGVELGPGLGQLGDAGLVHARSCCAHSQLMRWMFIGAATQLPFGFITGSSSGATTLSQPSAAGELVDVGGAAGRVPLGDFRALELHGGRRVAGDHVGAELGERVGGVAGDRGLLPVAAGGGEHLAELGDGRGVGAGRPLVQHVGLRLGVRGQAGDNGQQGGAGESVSKCPHLPPLVLFGSVSARWSRRKRCF